MIALYGAGQEFVNLINAGKLKKIDFVVDTNSQYYGGGVCGYTIYDKSKLSDLTEEDFVCITSMKYFDEIFQTIREINSEVTIINIYQLYWMENTLPDLLRELRTRDDVYEQANDDQVRVWMKESNDDEIEYWKKRIPAVKNMGDRRFTEREFMYPYNPEISIREEDLVLDVGAGPLPKFGNIINGHKLKYIPLDPLAYSYREILDELKIVLPVYTKFAFMEILTCYYAAESADYVIVNNALDHSIDVLRAFVECLKVVRIGGYLLLEHMEAEGAHNGYTGLHTWNITSIDNDLIFFDEINKVNVSSAFSECCAIETKRIKQGYRDLIIAKIHKKGAVPADITRKFDTKEFAGKIIDDLYKERSQEMDDFRRK